MKPALAFVVLVFAVLMVAASCQRTKPATVDAAVKEPTVRLYVVSTTAGALEPCGCTKDQLGGVDHAAAYVKAEGARAPHALVVAAGPMLFLNPKLEEARATQDLWKAEALAQSLGDLGLVAWAPGENDWANGGAELERLAKLSRADVLAGNLSGATGGAKATRLVEINGYKVGIAGVSEPKGPFGAPEGVNVGDPKAALEAAHAELAKQGAQLFVALVAAERGRALRLAEQVPSYQALVVGKPYDQGEGNDAPIPPVLVGDTLVVQAPNHLQGIAVVDLYVRGALAFKDGTGIAALEQKESLTARITDLQSRIRNAEAGGASAGDVAARKEDLARLEKELAAVPSGSPPSEGSFFRYSEQPVRAALGTSQEVATRMGEYYRRVNDHNREAFKDRVPPEPKKGEATYIGAEECSNCHEAAYEFWKKTPHAKAYAALADQHKEFNLDCVSCHVTGYEKPGGSTVTHVTNLKDVQCENCHGPGSLHEADPKSLTALVRSPPKTLCAATCHHPPHVQEGWSVDEAWKVIIGPGHGRAAK